MIIKDDREDYFENTEIEETPQKPKGPALKPEDPDYWEQEESEFEHLRPRRRVNFWVILIAAGILLGIAVTVYLRYFSPYVTEGVQYGYVDEIEKRGEVFKTFEGVLIPYKEKNDTTRIYPGDITFSVNDNEVAVNLLKLMNGNLPVRMEYKRYHGRLPWRGETTMIIVKADTAEPTKILPPEFSPEHPYQHINKAAREKLQ